MKRLFSHSPLLQQRLAEAQRRAPLHTPIAVFLMLLMGTIAAAQPEGAQEAQLVIEHDGVVTSAAWSPDESQILTTAEDSTARITDAESGDTMQVIEHGDSVRGGGWLDGGSHVITWTSDGEIRITEAESGATSDSVRIEEDVMIQLGAVASDGSAVAVAAGDTVYRYLVDGVVFGEALPPLSHESEVVSVEWAGDQLRSFEEGGIAHIWERDDSEALRSLDLGRRVLGAAWSDDESQLLSWGVDGAVQIWNTDRRRILRSMDHRSFADGARWVSAEAQVLSWGGDDTARLWDAETGNPLYVMPHNDWVEGAYLNEDGSRVLSWSFNAAWLWGLGDDSRLLNRFTHQNLVSGAIWNDAETEVLTWSWDGTARVWSLAAPSEEA